jgi:hypothetical protein
MQLSKAYKQTLIVSSLSPFVAVFFPVISSGVYRGPTFMSTMAVIMCVAPTVIFAAKNILIGLRYNHAATVISFSHVSYASCHGHQASHNQPNLDTIRLIHEFLHNELGLFTD